MGFNNSIRSAYEAPVVTLQHVGKILDRSKEGEGVGPLVDQVELRDVSLLLHHIREGRIDAEPGARMRLEDFVFPYEKGFQTPAGDGFVSWVKEWALVGGLIAMAKAPQAEGLLAAVSWLDVRVRVDSLDKAPQGEVFRRGARGALTGGLLGVVLFLAINFGIVYCSSE